MVLPNFIVFGALKAGTTSLYHYLRSHPQIYLNAELKESRFFAYNENDPELRNKPDELFPIRSLQDYTRLFDGVTNETAIGEVCPGYLESPIAAAQIKQHIPHSKLIASLRNPVDRAYSIYQMAVRAGAERRSIETALASDSAEGYFKPYYANLKRYFDLFDRENLRIILFEDFRTDTQSVIRGLFEFLDVDDAFTPDMSIKHNPGGLPRSQLVNRLTKIKNKKLKIFIRRLTPEGVRNVFTKVRHQNLEPSPPLRAETRRQLTNYFRNDILRLQDLLQKDLSVWLEQSSSEQEDTAASPV